MQKMRKAAELFEKVYVINLKRRPDRLARFWQEIEDAQWPFAKPHVFSAIEGDKVGVPKFWQTGGGSYGCLRSHMSLLERAIQDDINSLLILEDDAEFMPNFHKEVILFLDKVPDDWQCLMLGGQHVNSICFPILPGVVRAGAGGGIQRTHCYALRGREIMVELYRTWADAAVHCDWVMGPCTANFNTYAPDPFLVGQSAGESDIAGSLNPAKFWRSPTGLEPVIVLRAPRLVADGLQKKGWHGGHNRDASTGIDNGLIQIFNQSTMSKIDKNKQLQSWISMIQNEVASMRQPSICTIWHPEVDEEAVQSLVKGKVIGIEAVSVEDALNQLAEHIKLYGEMPEKDGKITVVLLRSSRAVKEVLGEAGWHCGYWKDEITGQDNGLRQLFSIIQDRKGRMTALREMIYTLHQEAMHMQNGVVTIWHDEVTEDLLQHNNIRVIEIVAKTAIEAKQKLKEYGQS